MKSTDLMVGDWVMIPPNIFVQIEEIKIELGEYRMYLKDTAVFVTEEDIDPIPLTPEILEKNGAYKTKLMGEDRHFEYCLDGFTMLAIYDADFSFQINGGARKIKYVHQLQHALKLCGIAKEIII